MTGFGQEHPSSALRGSLRLRLLIGTLAWIAVSIIVAGWALDGLFRNHIARQFHAELNTHLDQLAAHLAVDQTGQVSLSAAQSDPRFNKPYSGGTGRSTALACRRANPWVFYVPDRCGTMCSGCRPIR